MKALSRQNKTYNTLKKNYEVWEDRPKELSSQTVPSIGIWN